MAIQAQLADGRILEFPDDTDHSVIQSTVKRLVSEGGSTPPAAPAKGQDSMKAWEPSALEEVVNVGKRGLLQAQLTSATLAFKSGLMDSATYAEKVRELNRKMGAAAPSGETAAGLERLQEANEAGDIGKTVTEVLSPKNWKALGALIGESAVATAENLPMVAAGAVTGGPYGAAAMSGATSFAAEFGSTIGDLLEKKGISPSDPVAVRNAIEDPKFMAEARERGLKRGIPVALFDALSAGFAGRFIRTLEKAAGAKAVAKAGAKELGVQAGAGMAGEATGQALTGENKPLDVLVEGLAEVPGGIAEATSNIYAANRRAGLTTEPEEETAPPGAPEAPPSATPAATPVAPVAPDRATQETIDVRARQISDTLGIPEDDAILIAKKQLMDEAQQLGKTMPTVTPVAEDARISERAQEYIDTGMPKEEALKVATAEIQEEDKADALAEAEARGDQNVARPVSAPGGEGVSVAGQPSAVTPTGGAGVAEPSGVVPAGQDVAGAEAGAAAQPEAVKGVEAASTALPKKFLHGTTPENKAAILESGKFLPGDKRQYAYSQFGRNAVYFSPEEGWWLNKEAAENGRAAVYPESVEAKLDPQAQIAVINSVADLDALAKKVGYVDGKDLMRSLDVDGLDAIEYMRNARSMSLAQFKKFYLKDRLSYAPKEVADRVKTFDDLAKEYEQSGMPPTTGAELEKSAEHLWNDAQAYENTFKVADEATQRLLNAGVDGIYIAKGFADSVPEEMGLGSYYPAQEQLAMFNHDRIRPVVEPKAQPAAPARPRGRPRLSEEQKASAEAARKQQRIAANQASRAVAKAEESLQKVSEPLDPDNFETDEEFAEAEKEQRLKRAETVRTLYQISRENKNKPGQRAAEILKGLNPREVADAKAGYEYQKKQAAEQVSRSGQGAKGVEPVNPALTKVTNGAQAITQILKTGTGFQKMLAKRIRSFVGNVKIVVIEQGQELPEQLQRPKNLASWERSRGLYIENTKTKTRTVYLRGESFGDDQGVNTVTVLHELLHAAVNLKLGQALLAAQRGYSQNTQLAKAYGDLLRTMNSARSLFNDMAREGRLPKHFSDLARAGNIFDDPREFVAYGMTDPEFQQILMQASGYEEDTSFFTRFVDAIRRMLGMDEDSVNALSDLIVVTDKVLSAPLPADMRLVAYGMPEQASAQGLNDEEKRSQRQIHRAVSEALHKVNTSRTGEEYGKAITALHAIKDPDLIIPYLKQAWAYGDDKVRNALAAIPTFDFLARWTKDTVPELSNTNKLLEQMSGMSHQLLAKVGEMSETVLNAFKKDPTLRKKLEDVVYTSTLAQVDPSDPKAKERDKRLDTLYKDLGADGQRVYKMLRDYYRNMTEYYSHLLDKQIEDLDVSDETKKNLLAAVKTIYEGGQKITPYFPLVRRGDFWLSVGTGKTRQFYLFETKAERDNAAKELAAGQRTSLEELLDEKKFSLGNDVSVLRQASYQSSGLLRQIFDAIDNSNMSDPDARETLKDAVYQIYLQSMPEQSFRRQFIHRKGIAGFSTDLLRNINTTGAKTSVQLTRIKYGPALRNSLAQARESIAPTPEYEPFVISAENRVRAALTAGRKGDSVDQAFEATAGVANKASYIWYLSGAASALIQPFSVYISGLPILSAHHSPAAAAKELAKMVTLMNQYGVVRQNADGTRSYLAPSLANNQDLPEDERRAIKEMLGRGVTQSTYASEVFGYKSTPSEALYFDPTRGVIDNIPAAYGKTKRFANILLGGLMHNTERLSREAIYLASYRLSRNAGKSHDAAVDQAVIDTNEALGNYDMTNRPIMMQKPGGKILLQFQMFPLHTSLLLLTNFKRMLPLLNKEGKREAAIKFFGIMGTAFSVAGLVGVPGFSAVMGLLGWAWKELGKDDDWPEDLKSLDFETWFRTVFLPKELGADLALVLEHGPLNAATGLDFASRLSLNNLWGRDTKETKSTREGVMAAALSHAGPTASMILSLADGYDAWNLGDTKKAAEKLTPAAVRNVVVWKHMREDGVKDYRGAQLMSPEAIKTGELFGQIIGFRPALSADLQEKNFKLLGIENRINNERGKILIRLDNAYQARDMKAYRKAFEEVQDFNKGFPSYAIEPDDIASSLEKKQEQRGKSYRGVVPTEKNVPLIGDALVQSRKLVQQREKDVRKKD